MFLIQRQTGDVAAGPGQRQRLVGLYQRLNIEDGRIAALPFKRIAKFRKQGRVCRSVHIGLDLRPIANGKRADIINPVRLVGMIMGEQDGIQSFDFGIEQLLTQIR